MLDEVSHLEGGEGSVDAFSAQGEEEPVTLYNIRADERPVLDTQWYANVDDLLRHLKECVIGPAELHSRYPKIHGIVIAMGRVCSRF